MISTHNRTCNDLLVVAETAVLGKVSFGSKRASTLTLATVLAGGVRGYAHFLLGVLVLGTLCRSLAA